MDALGSAGSGLTSESVAITVILSGELDLTSGRELAVLGRTVHDHPGREIVVDLSEVSFMDSAALHAFADARAQATRAGGAVTLVGATPFAQRLLEIWHLEPEPSWRWPVASCR